MRTSGGQVTEIWLEGGEIAGQIACPVALCPAPGQYLLAHAIEGEAAPLASALFPAGYAPGGFLTAPGLPAAWLPGTQLALRGRLGNGFHLPAGARRVAAACLSPTPARLRPVVAQALEAGCAVTLYADSAAIGAARESWPAALEVYPVEELPGALAWADFLAIDVPLGMVSAIRPALNAPDRLPCPAQVLVWAPFPCGGIADCGVCSVRGRHGWKLACKDGPVFDLADLDW